ncbi:hypothetical protein [Oceanirhabdus sp. W0125-5]|uniref:hypothetical protein n=1 Tax=Oceanirhabdus sp. W0125-5 TaxID=2999116 RepID=UPI0022F344FB|nr:hypothetical protein [Oceanirhabdus sp. W0125-5]WBW98855.1 hypothetical protein OW730_08965 [Oceanirhabdus sp. W0125-5]
MNYPIKKTVSCKWGLLKGIDLITSSEVHAYIGNDRSVIIATDTRPITAIERWRKRCSKYHVVDMSINTFVSTFQVSSMDSMKKFTVRADVSIYVDNPERIVESGIRFDNSIFRDIIKRKISVEALQHDVKDYHIFSSKIDRAAIEREINEMGFNVEPVTINIEPDVNTKKIIDMQLDEEYESYKRKLAFDRVVESIENDGKIENVKIKTKKDNMERIADVKITMNEKLGALGDNMLSEENKTFANAKAKNQSEIDKLKKELREVMEEHSKANKENNTRLLNILEKNMDDITGQISVLEGRENKSEIKNKEIEETRKTQKFHDTTDEYQ